MMAEAKKKETVKQDPELKAAAEASTAATNEARKAPKAKKSGVGVLRKKGTSQTRDFFPSKIPYPEGIHGENFELYGPAGFASYVPEGTDISVYSNDQEFMIDPEKVKVLWFQNPDRNLAKKRLYMIKGIHQDGRLTQFPFESQIQNNAGGDPNDAIGLHRYERKGVHLLIDWTTLIPIYCAAWGCFAAAAQNGNHIAFCGLRHADHTLPNRHKGEGGAAMGMFSKGVTTSRTWT
jgi:hypothetical protein